MIRSVRVNENAEKELSQVVRRINVHELEHQLIVADALEVKTQVTLEGN